MNSFIITPEYFKIPETGKLPPESGVEDRWKTAIMFVCPNFTAFKDDNSDGRIVYNENREIKFCGIQECKLYSAGVSLEKQATQGFAYIREALLKDPNSKYKHKFIFLSTEKGCTIVYLDNILDSTFWTEFCFYYDEYRSKKGHYMSTFYKDSLDIQALMADYFPRFRRSHYEIGESLDFKVVVNEILENCYERD